MLSLTDLLKLAETEHLPLEKRRGIVREYIHTLILFYIQKTKYARGLIFIGGTALRFFYELQRFSEDLDFNYQGTLSKSDLKKLLDKLKKELQKENIEMQYAIRKSTETYFHWKIYLQFPEVLQYYECAGRKTESLHPAEKLSIQFDLQNLGGKQYPLAKKIIARFGKRFLFNTTTLDMFLVEKSNAVLYRNPPRGRDFFDLMLLMLKGAKPDLKLLQQRDISIKNKQQYKRKIQNRVAEIDFKELSTQLSPFLFNPEDQAIMLDFPNQIEDIIKKL